MAEQKKGRPTFFGPTLKIPSAQQLEQVPTYNQKKGETKRVEKNRPKKNKVFRRKADERNVSDQYRPKKGETKRVKKNRSKKNKESRRRKCDDRPLMFRTYRDLRDATGFLSGEAKAQYEAEKEEKKRAEQKKKRAEQKKKRAEQEKKRAEKKRAEKKRAEQEKKRAEQEKKRAEHEKKRAELEKKQAEQQRQKKEKLTRQMAFHRIFFSFEGEPMRVKRERAMARAMDKMYGRRRYDRIHPEVDELNYIMQAFCTSHNDYEWMSTGMLLFYVIAHT